MNKLTFNCSEHGEQIAESVSVGIVPSIPVRITLACGCSWIWAKDLTWKQQVMSNGLQEMARKEAGPKGC